MSEESNTSSSNADAAGGGTQRRNLLPVEIEEEEEDEINVARFNKGEDGNIADKEEDLDNAWPEEAWTDLSDQLSSQSDPRRDVEDDSVIGVYIYPDPPPQESIVAPIPVDGDTDYDSNNSNNNTSDPPLEGRIDVDVNQTPNMFQANQRTQSEVDKSLVRLKKSDRGTDARTKHKNRAIGTDSLD